jgi:hypothetical protein
MQPVGGKYDSREDGLVRGSLMATYITYDISHELVVTPGTPFLPILPRLLRLRCKIDECCTGGLATAGLPLVTESSLGGQGSLALVRPPHWCHCRLAPGRVPGCRLYREGLGCVGQRQKTPPPTLRRRSLRTCSSTTCRVFPQRNV